MLVFCFHIFVSFFSRKLLLSGGTETNPGPRIHSNNHFTICHWNLNKIFVHNFAKVQLLKAHLAVHKFDMVCLSKTYLNSSFPFDDDNLDIPSYIMARADHTVKSLIQISSRAFGLPIGDNLRSFISIYISINQSYLDFVSFRVNFELTLNTLAQKNPF